jgi:hypothetical protein
MAADQPEGGRKEKAMSTNQTFVNITPTEHIARVLVGLTGPVAAGLLLGTADTGLAVPLELLLALAGLDLVVTGATGHCPLYTRLGHVPASLKGQPRGPPCTTATGPPTNRATPRPPRCRSGHPRITTRHVLGAEASDTGS